MTLLPARNVAHVAGALRESPSSRVSMMAAESANIWINRVILWATNMESIKFITKEVTCHYDSLLEQLLEEQRL